jgi:hypothetical protein
VPDVEDKHGYGWAFFDSSSRGWEIERIDTQDRCKTDIEAEIRAIRFVERAMQMRVSDNETPSGGFAEITPENLFRLVRVARQAVKVSTGMAVNSTQFVHELEDSLRPFIYVTNE